MTNTYDNERSMIKQIIREAFNKITVNNVIKLINRRSFYNPMKYKMEILSKNLELKCAGYERNNYGEATIVSRKINLYNGIVMYLSSIIFGGFTYTRLKPMFYIV